MYTFVFTFLFQYFSIYKFIPLFVCLFILHQTDIGDYDSAHEVLII